MPEPPGISRAVDVFKTQAAELKHGFKVTSNDVGSDDLSIEAIEFDCALYSEPAMLSMSIWKDMKFQQVLSVDMMIAESVLTLVKNEGLD